MTKNDDIAPDSYPYLWRSSSGTSVSEFVTKYKPSMVQDDGTKPWLWVFKDTPKASASGTDAAIEEGVQYLKEVTEKIEAIKNDDSIPTRANKKKGFKSKKELREELQAEATEKLKDISVRNGHVSGKWLIFAPSDKVDLIWSTIATSLIEGSLMSTCVDAAKVATCPRNETPNYQHVMCLYMPDVYDKEKVIEVMKVLLRKHGLNLMGVKSNLYTSIGLDSKHPSGIQSTVWRNNALMKDSEIKELKDAFYAELNEKKAGAPEKSKAPAEPVGSSSKLKPKAPLKKKGGEDDPFASEPDDDAGKDQKMDVDAKDAKPPKAKRLPAKRKVDEDVFVSDDEAEKAPAKKAPPPKRKKVEDSGFVSDDEDGDEGEDKRKQEVKSKTKKPTSASKRATKDVTEEDSENERPKKRATRAKK